MDKKTVIWLVTAACFLLIGCIIFGCVMMAQDWDFSKLSTVKYETNEYEITDPFQNITILTDTADIVLVSSEAASVVCTEQVNARHNVWVKDGTLQIEIVDQIKWYERIGLNFGTPKITVYIPQGQYEILTIQGSTGDVKIPGDYKFTRMDIHQNTGDVTCQAFASDTMKIRTSTGSIYAENVNAGRLELSVTTGNIIGENMNCEGDINIRVSTGKTSLTNVSCRNLTTSGNTGNIMLKNVVAAGKFTIERTTGDVKFDGCDAAEIDVNTDTGDVTGTLLSSKVFLCNTDTGSVDVPKTTAGGRCEITTDTGDIHLTID